MNDLDHHREHCFYAPPGDKAFKKGWHFWAFNAKGRGLYTGPFPTCRAAMEARQKVEKEECPYVSDCYDQGRRSCKGCERSKGK